MNNQYLKKLVLENVLTTLKCQKPKKGFNCFNQLKLKLSKSVKVHLDNCVFS